MNCKSMLLAAAFLFAAAGSPALTQDQQASSPDQSAPAFAVPAGTRYLIGLDDNLCTKDDKAGKSFHAHTLEPLVAPDGRVIPIGTRIRGQGRDTRVACCAPGEAIAPARIHQRRVRHPAPRPCDLP